MNSFGVKFIGHNIPRVLPIDFSTIFAFRVHNTLNRDLYFQSHASFYGSPINDPRSKLSVLLNGVFLKTVLIDKDCLRRKTRTTLYFPFRVSDEGEYCLQIVMGEERPNAVSNEGLVLFETSLRVKMNCPGFILRRMIRHGLFTFLHTEIPIQLKRLKLQFYKKKLDYCHHNSERKKRTINQYKEINRELAFMEKQVRKLRVASLPCYLGIDTSYRCNLKCKMCFRRHVDIDYNSRPDMSDDTLDRLINELFPTAITLNLSSVGEPLNSIHVDKILKACIVYQVYLSITTNGTLIRGDDFIKKLVSVLHYIEISVDSADPNVFEKLRTGASYEYVIQNARKLGAIRRSLPEPKFNLAFSMTLFRENLKEIPDVLHIVSEVGGNLLKTDIGVIFSKKELHQSVLSCPSDYNEMYKTAHEKAKQLGITLMMRPPFSEKSQTQTIRNSFCDYLYLSMCVSSEGELNPCYFQPISSLNVKKGFRTAWNSKLIQQLRLEHATNTGNQVCKDCHLFLEGNDSLKSRRKQFLEGDAL